MKRHGAIEVIQTIEDLIWSYPESRLVGGASVRRDVQGVGIRSAVYARLYEIYYDKWVIQVRVAYDERNGTGRVQTREEWVKILISAIPATYTYLEQTQVLTGDGRYPRDISIIPDEKVV